MLNFSTSNEGNLEHPNKIDENLQHELNFKLTLDPPRSMGTCPDLLSSIPCITNLSWMKMPKGKYGVDITNLTQKVASRMYLDPSAKLNFPTSNEDNLENPNK
ncbi:hypothetical protein KY289_023966 [Solanum tuberosum]|nr:hypothetical protein KY289_023966 [Solanum tuberosum]